MAPTTGNGEGADGGSAVPARGAARNGRGPPGGGGGWRLGEPWVRRLKTTMEGHWKGLDSPHPFKRFGRVS